MRFYNTLSFFALEKQFAALFSLTMIPISVFEKFQHDKKTDFPTFIPSAIFEGVMAV